MKLKIYLIFILSIISAKVYSQTLSNEKLKDSIEKIIKTKRIPGGIITVVTKDSILFQTAFGHSDLESDIKTQKKNVFKIASLTKTFTVMAIMRLVNEGKLSLEDELKLLAPEIVFKNKWEDRHPIKIKHLIEHKSGFSDYSYAHLANRYKELNTTDSFDEILALKSALKSNWKPGLVTSYSNPGYAILGYIIEKKSGKLYSDYIKDDILIPLGMINSGFLNHYNNEERNLIVNGYIKIDTKIVETKNKNKSIGFGSTGLISNMEDMSRFLQYFLNNNLQQTIPLVGVGGVHKMESLHSEFDITNKIKTGYNMSLEDRIFGKKEILFKGNSGLTDGFVSNFIYNRELDIGVFVSTNLFGVSNRAIIDLVINNYCKSKEINSEYKVLNNDLSRFKDWEGEHRELNDTQEIWNFINFPVRSKTVKIEGNDLVISDIENGEYIYKNVGGNAFLSEEYGENIPTVYLTEYEGEKSLRYYENTFVTTSKSFYVVLIIVIVFSLFILLTAVIVLVINLIIYPFKKSTKVALVRVFIGVLPFLFLLLSIYLAMSNLSFERIPNLGSVSSISVTIFILTLLLPIVCIWQVFSFIKEKKQLKNDFFKFFWSLVTFSNIFISLYCVVMGWFAVRFWV